LKLRISEQLQIGVYIVSGLPSPHLLWINMYGPGGPVVNSQVQLGNLICTYQEGCLHPAGCSPWLI